jgi:hypothetical protein
VHSVVSKKNEMLGPEGKLMSVVGSQDWSTRTPKNFEERIVVFLIIETFQRCGEIKKLGRGAIDEIGSRENNFIPEF